MANLRKVPRIPNFDTRRRQAIRFQLLLPLEQAVEARIVDDIIGDE
jgi:hypothetical protein